MRHLTLSSMFLAAFLLTGCGDDSKPPAACTAGTLACECREGGACDGGLVCGASGTCAASTVVTLRVSDPAARGCETVLEEKPGTSLTGVRFQQGVEGAFIREAPRTAVSFVAGSDSAIPETAVELQLTGAVSGLSAKRTSCVDARGQRLTGATLSIR